MMAVTPHMVLQRLRGWVDSGHLRQIDFQFARLLAELCQQEPHAHDAELVLAAAWVSAQLGKGHVCLPLSQTQRVPLFDLPPAAASELLDGLAPIESWATLWQAHRLVGIPDQDPAEADDAEACWPLRLWRGRLYLSRYYRFEAQVAARLLQLAGRQVAVSTATLASMRRLFALDADTILASLLQQRQAATFDASRFARQYLDLVAPDSLDAAGLYQQLAEVQSLAALQSVLRSVPSQACRNDQHLAAATALSRALAVISGGPGTGKTTTVAKLLALLAEQGVEQGRPPVIRLAAPTGKAAARLAESLGQALVSLPLSAPVRAAMPNGAGTLHRLLGVVPGQLQFRHHAGNPLHLDILVVDEASMVDLPLMARLLSALPEHARLILLGDKDQLASVEAGSVLGDICSVLTAGVSPPQAQWLSTQTGYTVAAGDAEGPALRDSLCLLRKSWRFSADSGIGQLANACNQGRPEALAAIWQHAYADIQLQPWGPGAYRQLIAAAVQGYCHYLTDVAAGAAVATIFARFNRFQLLCALRDGPFGVTGLNAQIERALAEAGLVAPEHDWYAGRPVMVIQNDHAIGLYNGDIGLCLPDDNGRLRVWFETGEGQLRSLLPSRVPAHETVYAMTIHKSQGSEFAQVIMVLPDQMSPLLSRELIYTGITRAKQQLTLYADPTLLAQAIRRRTERYSGLSERFLSSRRQE